MYYKIVFSSIMYSVGVANRVVSSGLISCKICTLYAADRRSILYTTFQQPSLVLPTEVCVATFQGFVSAV